MVITTSIVKARLYPYKALVLRLYQSHAASSSSSPYRYFSAAVPPQNKNDDDDEQKFGFVESAKKLIIEKVVTPKNQFYMLVAGGSFGAYVISKGLISFTSFFTHLSPLSVARYSFYTGFGTASILGGLSLVTAENLYIRADPVYKYCKNWVVKDDSVNLALGDGIRAGKLRSYRLDPGNFHFDGTSLIWRPPRIQMLFDVSADGPPYRTGLVTAEATKNFGFPPRLKTNLLKVDYETGEDGKGGTVEGNETIFLVGDDKDMTRVSSRSGLSLEKLVDLVHISRGARR